MVVVTILNVWSTQEKDENAISGIPFIVYAQNQKIEIPNNLKVFNSKKTKEPNRRAYISYGQWSAKLAFK